MKVFSKIKKTISKKISEVNAKVTAIYLLATTNKIPHKNAVRTLLADCRGENFVDSGLKILIAVVLGALLLAGLYALFGDTILPTLTNKVKELFNFNG